MSFEFVSLVTNMELTWTSKMCLCTFGRVLLAFFKHCLRCFQKFKVLLFVFVKNKLLMLESKFWTCLDHFLWKSLRVWVARALPDVKSVSSCLILNAYCCFLFLRDSSRSANVFVFFALLLHNLLFHCCWLDNCIWALYKVAWFSFMRAFSWWIVAWILLHEQWQMSRASGLSGHLIILSLSW